MMADPHLPTPNAYLYWSLASAISGIGIEALAGFDRQICPAKALIFTQFFCSTRFPGIS